MPLMKGPSPIRRTLKYLESGTLILKDIVKIMIIHYNRSESDSQNYHQGIRDFIFWDLPQIQYKNQVLQIVKIENLTPTPFLMFYLENEKKMYMDIFAKKREEIMAHIKNTLGKTEEQMAKEAIQTGQMQNPANFGPEYPRECISEIPGQVYSPSIRPLPDRMRGKMLFPEGRTKIKKPTSVWALTT